MADANGPVVVGVKQYKLDIRVRKRLGNHSSAILLKLRKIHFMKTALAYIKRPTEAMR
jgi:hypothetical protein